MKEWVNFAQMQVNLPAYLTLWAKSKPLCNMLCLTDSSQHHKINFIHNWTKNLPVPE